MVHLKHIRLISLLFLLFLNGTQCSTHWIVTESGLIQSQLDSAFHLRRPYDLLALLEQEERAKTIDELYKELISRKARIDRQWSHFENSGDLEQKLYARDPDCLNTVKQQLDDTALYISLFGDLKERIKIDRYFKPYKGSIKAPNCESRQPYTSLFTFDHLQGMRHRHNISMSPESELIIRFLGSKDINEFGSQVSQALAQNSTGWLEANLASIYWRMVGNAPKALECARKAVLYAPRHYKDLALLNLGAIFHQAKRSAEAAIVLHAALDHQPRTAEANLMLANVYVVLGDYNRSAQLFDNTMKLSENWQNRARAAKHAVTCQRKLEDGLIELHDSLQDILRQLHEYHAMQQDWLHSQELLMWQQAPLEIRLLTHNHYSLSALLNNRGQSCIQKIQDGRTVLSCDVNNESHMLAHHLQLDITLSLQMLLKNVELQAMRIKEQMVKRTPLGQKARDARAQCEQCDSMILPGSTPFLNTEAGVNESEGSEFQEESIVSSSPPDTINGINMENDANLQPLVNEEDLTFVITDQSVDSVTLDVTIPETTEKISNSEKNKKENWHKPASERYTAETLRRAPRNLLLETGHVDSKDCDSFGGRYPTIGEQAPHAYLPPQNKGFNVERMLTRAIRVSAAREHPLPWYTPLCILESGEDRPIEHAAAIAAAEASVHLPRRYDENELRSALSELMPSTTRSFQIAEVGQRMVSAMNKETGPSWLLSTLAALYWRVRGQPKNAIDCLYASLEQVPARYRDVPLVSLGAILRRIDRPRQALRVANEAHNVNRFEPATHLLLASLYEEKHNLSGAWYHLAQAMIAEPALRVEEGIRLAKAIRCKIIFELREQQTPIEACEDFNRLPMSRPEDAPIAFRTFLDRLPYLCSKQHQCVPVQCVSANYESGGIISRLLASTNTPRCGPGEQSTAAHVPADEGDLERMDDPTVEHTKDFYVRVSFGDESVQIKKGPKLTDFYVSISMPEVMLYLHDGLERSPLSPSICKKIQTVEWRKQTVDWHFIGLDLNLKLIPLAGGVRQPKCRDDATSTEMLNKLSLSFKPEALEMNPEPELIPRLGADLFGDPDAPVELIGARLALDMIENDSWMLKSAASLYWRAIGSAPEAVWCLQQALELAPTTSLHLHFTGLANVLFRAGHFGDALKIGNLALHAAPEFDLAYFTVANIYNSMGEINKAITMFRSALAIRSSFSPAKNRLRALFCNMLFDEEDEDGYYKDEEEDEDADDLDLYVDEEDV